MTTEKKAALSFFFTIALLVPVLLAVSACKPQGKNTFVIGYVNPNPEEVEGAQGFLRNMPKFGYIEGKNVTYIKCESRDRKVMEAALENMVAKKADLIFTMTTPATKLAKQVTEGTKIPVVFILFKAIESGVVDNLIHHGGNITGVQLAGSTSKALDWLLAIAPGTRRVFVPVSFDTGAALHSLEDLEESTAKAGLKLTISEVHTAGELRESLSSMPNDTGAIFILHSWLIGSNLDILIESAKKRKIPIFSAGHLSYDGGVVLSYGPLDDTTGLQVARLAHNILKGTPPRDLPVETSDFSLGINLPTARKIGIKIPDDVLQQAKYIVR